MSAIDDLCLELNRVLSQQGGVRQLARDELLVQRLAAVYISGGGDWLDIKQVFRGHKGALRDGVELVVSKSRELQGVRSIGARAAEGQLVKDVFPTAPVADDAVMPNRYGLVDSMEMAIYRKQFRTVDGMQTEQKVCVSYQPVFITCRMQQKESGKLLLRLAWKVGRHWHEEVFERDHIFSTREILKAAGYGLSVGSDNAMDLVQYLRDYENRNQGAIEIAYSGTQMGWLGDDENPTKHGFLCGHRQLGGNGKAFQLRTVGAGEDDEAKSIGTGGDFDTWRELIREFDRWPVVKLLTYAMLAAPLLPILDAPNAIIESVNRTSRGKTEAVKMAASVWRSTTHKPRTWDATLNNFESLSQLYNGIPLVMDDTMLVIRNQGLKGEEQIGKAIYKYVAGVGRGRDTRDGGQRSVHRWRSVLISTGETPSSDLAHAEGAAARVLSFWAPPTGEISPETGAIVFKLVRRGLAQNYGHAGPAVVKWLHENRERWDELRSKYEEITKMLRKMFPTPAGTRLSEIIALLDMAAYVGAQAGCFPWEVPDSVAVDPTTRAVIEEAVRQASHGADRAKQAWIHAVSYASARSEQWLPWGAEPDDMVIVTYGDKQVDKPRFREPSGGFLGWRDDNRLAWYPSQLRRALADGGFPLESTMRSWKDEGASDGLQRIQCGDPKGPDGGRRRLVTLRTTDTPWDDTPKTVPSQTELIHENSNDPDDYIPF